MEDEDWLDYVPLEIKDSLEPDDTEELLCFRKRGRGSMEHRFVPRLPLRAMIQRMKLLDESSNSGRQHGSRGRARILQDRARSNRPHGLHQKKQEKVAPKVEREVHVTEDAPVVESSKDRKEDMYNHHWNQNDFPSLGIEQTVEGSPKKKCKHMTSGSKRSKKSSDAKETERVTEMESCREESRALCISENLVQEPDVETEIVKPKTVIKKKFDFTKANQELLQEFPIAKQSGPKILSLTQHNLEKFLRESDTESSCSSQDLMSHNSTLENLDNVPVYQRYAVTLDDIKKSKAAKVPPKVKGHLANLLEAMDSYCDNPETYFANKANCEPPSSKKFESAVLNASVVSDLSNLSSPSENDFGIIDNCVEIVQRNVETVSNICNHICETAECQNKVLNSVTSGSDQPPRLSVNEMNGQTVTETEQSYKVKKNDIGELDEIKLMSGPVISAADCDSKEEDLEGFQKVVSKRKMSPRSVQSDDQSVWRIHGTNAIQVDGLPQNCELSELQSMVAGFGTVLDYQVLHVRGKDSVRFKLNSSDACQFAEQCLDDTDCLFPDYNCKLTCHQLQTGADE